MNQISLRLRGKTGQIDGYAEMILGIFTVSGVLLKHSMTKKLRRHDITDIYLELTVKAPPLGHLGEDDIPLR